jgi:hypothetical protein
MYEELSTEVAENWQKDPLLLRNFVDFAKDLIMQVVRFHASYTLVGLQLVDSKLEMTQHFLSALQFAAQRREEMELRQPGRIQLTSGKGSYPHPLPSELVNHNARKFIQDLSDVTDLTYW